MAQAYRTFRVMQTGDLMYPVFAGWNTFEGESTLAIRSNVV
jgi:hypothetical protein